MQPRVGDRFFGINTDGKCTWELIEISPIGGSHKAICIDGGRALYEPNTIHDVGSGLWEWTDKYKYLGNFSKSSSFTKLYEKLSNRD